MLTDEEKKQRKREYNREYYRKNQARILERKRDQYAEKPAKKLERQKQYVEKNSEKVQIYQKRYKQENKEYFRSYRRKYHSRRAATDPSYALSVKLRQRMNKAVGGDYKSGSAVNDLGCSIESFIIFIERKFQPGMSWDNYGDWHLDHIKPLAHFDLTDREQFLEAAHFSNYQPMWAADNLSKGAS